LFGFAFMLNMELHVAGRTATRISAQRDRAQVIFAARDLHWGFYHGAIAEATRHLAMQGRASELLAVCPDHEAMPYPYMQCLHGIGHGFALYRLFSSEDDVLCTSLPACHISQCMTGYGMELRMALNMTPRIDIRIYPKHIGIPDDNAEGESGLRKLSFPSSYQNSAAALKQYLAETATMRKLIIDALQDRTPVDSLLQHVCDAVAVDQSLLSCVQLFVEATMGMIHSHVPRKDVMHLQQLGPYHPKYTAYDVIEPISALMDTNRTQICSLGKMNPEAQEKCLHYHGWGRWERCV